MSESISKGSIRSTTSDTFRKDQSKKQRFDKQSKEYIIRSLLAGGVAGCAAKTVIAPFDRVKILFQTSNPVYGRYAGNQSIYLIILTFFLYSIYIYVYIFRKFSYRETEIEKMATAQSIDFSFFFFSLLRKFLSPISYCYCTGSFWGVFHAAKAIRKNSGIQGLFQGHSATILRIFPYAAIKFMAYEQIKAKLMPRKDLETGPRRAISGALAGLYFMSISQ